MNFVVVAIIIVNIFCVPIYWYDLNKDMLDNGKRVPFMITLFIPIITFVVGIGMAWMMYVTRFHSVQVELPKSSRLLSVGFWNYLIMIVLLIISRIIFWKKYKRIY